MKRYWFILIAMVATCTAFAQDYRDVVYLKNGSVIKGFYKELYPTDTLRMETLDGSLLVCPMSDVVRIAKERTNVYVINKEDESLTLERKWRTHSYSGSFEVMYGKEDEGADSYGLYTTHGYRFNRHLFLGAGLGFEVYAMDVSNLKIISKSLTIPIYAETRFYLLNTRISPVLVGRGGYSVCGVKGPFISPGVGVDFSITPRSAGFIHVMYRWQKCDYDVPNMSIPGFPMESKAENAGYILFTSGIRF